MWTRRIDRALDAIDACRRSLPELGELYPLGSPQREALARAVGAVEQARRVVFERRASAES